MLVSKQLTLIQHRSIVFNLFVLGSVLLYKLFITDSRVVLIIVLLRVASSVVDQVHEEVHAVKAISMQTRMSKN